MNHVKWLKKTGIVKGKDGIEIPVWEFNHSPDEKILSSWARHFRQHYCLDEHLDDLRSGTKLSRKDYLLQMVFPDAKNPPGPSIRSGDFAEILVADFLEYVQGYWTPRDRFKTKAVRNESVKGCDIIGFKFVKESEISPRDELAIFESKAGIGVGNRQNRLQVAVDDSAKDIIRKAETLNSLKRRFLERDERELALRVERFQNIEDRPYKEVYGAVALFSSDAIDKCDLEKTSIDSHPNSSNLRLMIIHGGQLMELVHALYQRAADEAG